MRICIQKTPNTTRGSIFLFCMICIITSCCKTPLSPITNIDWGYPEEGLKTKLTYRSPTCELGQPMLLQLEVMNVDDVSHEFQYSPVEINNLLKITRPDNSMCPYIAPRYQASLQSATLTPEESMTLFDSLDITTLYLIGEHGEYFVHFTGQQHVPKDLSALPPSNILRLRVQPGSLRSEDEVARRILSVMPDKWMLTRFFREDIKPAGRVKTQGFRFVIMSPEEIRIQQAHIFMWITDSAVKPMVSERLDAVGLSEYAGKSEWGYVYIMISEKAQKKWKDARARIFSALEIRTDED